MQPQQPYQPQPPQQPPQPYQPQGYPSQPQPTAPQPQSFQQPQYSIDYLNQIAPQQHKPKTPLPRLIVPLLIGGVVLFLLMALFGALRGGSSANLPTVAMRLQALQTVADGAKSKIKSNQLRVTNSNLSLYLTNANRDIATPLKNTGADPAKIKPTAAIQADTDKLTSTLEDARLNAVYDRVYARNMDYQLTTLLLQMAQLKKATGSASTRSFIDTTSANLTTIQTQLSTYTDSTN